MTDPTPAAPTTPESRYEPAGYYTNDERAAYDAGYSDGRDEAEARDTARREAPEMFGPDDPWNVLVDDSGFATPPQPSAPQALNVPTLTDVLEETWWSGDRDGAAIAAGEIAHRYASRLPSEEERP